MQKKTYTLWTLPLTSRRGVSDVLFDIIQKKRKRMKGDRKSTVSTTQEEKKNRIKKMGLS